MHYSTNKDEIKDEIEKLGHKVANVWNITQYRTKLPLSMFFVDLKPAPNNKTIFDVEILNQCKIKFEPPRNKREIAQCINCQRYGHTKNYCHLPPRCVKCAGDHLTHNCPRKDRSNTVRCVLCDGNQTANYKGCTVYQDLQKKTYPTLRTKQYSPPATIQKTTHTHPGVSYAQITSQNLPDTSNPAPVPPTNQPQQQTNGISELTALVKNLFDKMDTMLNLLITVITKIK
jgi:hypothetical protein